MGSPQKAELLYPRVLVFFKEKHKIAIVWGRNWLWKNCFMNLRIILAQGPCWSSPVSMCAAKMSTAFFFFSTSKNNWQINCGYSDLHIWQISSPKKKKKSKCTDHFKENNWQYLLPMIKIWIFKAKIKMWETCISLWAWHLSNT